MSDPECPVRVLLVIGLATAAWVLIYLAYKGASI
jgi:hypothetical protein